MLRRYLERLAILLARRLLLWAAIGNHTQSYQFEAHDVVGAVEGLLRFYSARPYPRLRRR